MREENSRSSFLTWTAPQKSERSCAFGHQFVAPARINKKGNSVRELPFLRPPRVRVYSGDRFYGM
jgi:hypothetical protein